MKSVVMSINPNWCELIAKGEKTVEVRKTKPKLETPFKVYIYCTKGETIYYPRDIFGNNLLNGKVIGEFVCEDIKAFGVPFPAFQNKMDKTIIEKSCMTYTDLHKYAGHDCLYAWHISNPVIYDKPRELREFRVIDNEAVQKCEHREQTYYAFTDTGYIKNGMYCRAKDDWCTKCKTKPLKRPPQSWCYVETTD